MYTKILLHAGHQTGCGGADPHNSLTSASSASLAHFFRIKQKEQKSCLIIAKNQLLYILGNKNSEVTDHFEAVFPQKKAMKTCHFVSKQIWNLQVFHTSFPDEPD